MIPTAKLKNTAAMLSSDDIDIIAAPLKNLGISYFSYTKLFNDQTRLYLSNNAVWTEAFHTLYYPFSLVNKHYSNYSDGYRLWSSQSGYKICQILLDFKIDYGINLIYKKDTYCELFVFGSHIGNYHINNFYLNNIDLLEKFVLYFKDKAHLLIKQAERDRLILPKTLEHSDSDVVDLVNNHDVDNFMNQTHIDRYYLSDNQGGLYLTKKEYSCFYYKIQGKSAKEIAKLLGISPSTVETHLNHVKLKLSCKEDVELATYFIRKNII